MYKIKNKHVFVKKKKLLKSHKLKFLTHSLSTIICYKKYNKIFFFDHF